MGLDTAASYDELPYGDRVFPETHPEMLAAVATLAGLKTAAPGRCRLLELGCGSGGNLMPLACSLPQSDFVGVDLSPRQIEQGQATQNTLGLNNLQLHAADILAIDESWGRFDYIVCHGVYSWVPPEVQDRILALCRLLLNPHGVAYISYNTYPGWHLKKIVLDYLNFHCHTLDSVRRRIDSGVASLNFLRHGIPPTEEAYANILNRQLDQLMKQDEAYFFHEYLEAHNEPLYFYQFMARAEQAGLQFVGEAAPNPLLHSLPPGTLEQMQKMANDLIEAEQYLDFLTGGGFRRTVLCHREAALARRMTRESLAPLRFTLLARAVGDTPKGDDAPAEFETPRGMKIRTTEPLVKAMLYALDEHRPRMLTLDELTQAIRLRLPNQEPDALLGETAEAVLRLYQSQLIEMRLGPPGDIQEVRERPVASPLARLQADQGHERLTNFRSRQVEPHPLDRLIVPLLDGTRDRQALTEALLGLARQGVFEVQQQGTALADEATMRSVLAGWVEESLTRLARTSLLIA